MPLSFKLFGAGLLLFLGSLLFAQQDLRLLFLCVPPMRKMRRLHFADSVVLYSSFRNPIVSIGIAAGLQRLVRYGN